jgi:hypothetical protein
MRNKITRTLVSILLTATFIIGAMATPIANTKKAQAAGSEYMKTLNLNWDLKKGKSVTLTTKYPGIGKQKYSVKLTSYKIEDADKEGYKKLTFSYVSTRKWTPSKKQVTKVFDTCYNKWAYDWCYFPDASAAYSIADYQTGTSLEGKNDYGVTVKTLIDFKRTNVKKFKGEDGSWVKLAKKITVKVQVTYPADYTDLCIGVLGANTKNGYGKSFSVKEIEDNGGFTFTDYTSADLDEEYFKATKYTKVKKNTYTEDENGTPFKFGQTSYYLQGKKNSHWLRVN